MRRIRELMRRLATGVVEPLNVSPYSVNAAIQKTPNIINSSEHSGFTHSQVTRRKIVLGGLIATAGVAGLLADFLYGGPIRNALYPQNSELGKTMTNLTSQITESESSIFSTAPATYTLEGRLFFDRGTSTFGTAGNGVQDDADSEPGEPNAKVLFLDANSNPVGTATTDSSGDFSIDLPTRNYTMYPVINNPNRTYGYMCQSLNEFRKITDGYPITVGENNPKLSIGLLQGWISYPQWKVTPDVGGYYDRDSRKGWIKHWDGSGGQFVPTEFGINISPLGADNDSGTHFEAQFGDIVSAFAPGIVSNVFPYPDNWVMIDHHLPDGTYYNTAYAHNSEVLVSVGQKISRYQPIAKAGQRGLWDDAPTIVHFQLGDFWNDNSGVTWFRTLDPYKPVFPIGQLYSGFWGIQKGVSYASWVSLPQDNNPNWENYWIVEDQTQF
jgi:hypothetical protein